MAIPAATCSSTSRCSSPPTRTSPSPSRPSSAGCSGRPGDAGFPIRVAIIASRSDLGAITGLWLKPRAYARFLGLELSLAYTGRLLVVMPNGFGFNWPGHAATAAYRTLSRDHDRAGGAGLATRRNTAVSRWPPRPASSYTGIPVHPRRHDRVSQPARAGRPRPRQDRASMRRWPLVAAALAVAALRWSARPPAAPAGASRLRRSRAARRRRRRAAALAGGVARRGRGGGRRRARVVGSPGTAPSDALAATRTSTPAPR